MNKVVGLLVIYEQLQAQSGRPQFPKGIRSLTKDLRPWTPPSYPTAKNSSALQ
jgi:hypothetical protein